MSISVKKAIPKIKNQPLLNINLQPLTLVGVAFLFFVPPFLRGLFFDPELLLVQQAAAGVFLLFVLDRLVKQESIAFSHPLDWLLCGLLLAYLVSISVAVDMRGAVRETLKYLNYLLVYWVVSRTARSERPISFLLHAVYLGAAGVAVVGLLSATGHLNFPGAWTGTFINSTLQYRNALAAYLVIAQIIGFTLWIRTNSLFPQVLLALAGLPVTTVLLLSQSRGGWILYPIAAALWLTGLQDRFWRGFYLFFLNLGVAMLTARAFLPEVVAGNSTAGLRVLLTACGVMAVAQLLINLGDRLLARRDLQPLHRNLFNYGGTLYIAAVVLTYLFYAAQALPRLGAQFLPVALLRRAGSITLEDPSAVGRFTYYGDAWEIIKNHPFLGAGGGAWNALYHRYKEGAYFSSEVHNHFLQTWVETGTVGFLFFTAFWLVLAFNLYLLWRRRHEAGPAFPLVWGSGIAALALLGHSAIDFNLSLPALAIILWGLAGIVRGAAADGPKPRQPVLPQVSLAKKPLTILIAQTAIGLLLALALYLPASRFYRAGQTGAAAARAVNAHNLTQARELMLKAHTLDPFTAVYLADLAQVEAVLGRADNDPASLERAEEYARHAVRLEPFNPRVRSTVSFAYLLLGRPDQAVAEAQALVDNNPLDVTAYEYLGRVAISAARQYLALGEIPMAGPYIQRAAQLPAKVRSRAAEVSTAGWKGPKLQLTPLLALSSGQARYLLGDYPAAAELLQAALADNRIAAEASIWLAAVKARQGDLQGAQLLLDQSGNADAEQIYRELLSLAPVLM